MPNLYQSPETVHTKDFFTNLFLDDLSFGHYKQAALYL